jgi:ectoine hydroxylase-related dioxygenase (phytanoyl-CoA dioxygenase family)
MINNHNLSDQDIKLYQVNGHTLIKQLINKSAIHQLRKDILKFVNSMKKDQLTLYKRDDFGENFLEVTNLWTSSSQIKEFVTSKHLSNIAARLLGVPSVRLHYDCIFFKEANGSATPWHQDQVSWPLDTNKTITIWIPLHDIPATVGSLNFISRSHAYQEISLRSAVRKGLKEVNYGALETGDVTFHNGWTLHSANANTLTHRREVFAITYFEDGGRIINLPDHMNHNSFYRFFPGLKVGNRANSRLNPLL